MYLYLIELIMSHSNLVKLRSPESTDLASIWRLLNTYRDRYLDDYQSITLDDVYEYLQSPTTQVLDVFGYPAGIVHFSDVIPELRGTIHLLIYPEFTRKILRAQIFEAILAWAFESLRFGKIMAYPLSTQTSAIKLLTRFQFYPHKPLYKHTRQGGKKVAMHPFELKKRQWRQFHQTVNKRKENL